MNDLYSERARQCDARIDALRSDLSERLAKVTLREDHPSLAIYATGSLARREATDNSDLDAFFMLSGEAQASKMGRIQDVKIFNAVVCAAETQRFPDFSNDGEYLKFLHIENVVASIGSRDDDYRNNFTARMLLLLESEWLYNKDAFLRFRKDVISAYFTDFHDHSTEFRPVFLINDVLRFWRTLCLNYENSRQWRKAEDEEHAAKGHLGNLKLKFSRLGICFSFISHLLSQGNHLTLENAIRTSELTPIKRLREVSTQYPAISEDIETLCTEYAWFLNATGSDKETTLAWISAQESRDEAFRHAARHIEAYGRMVRFVAEQNDYLRYLIV